ncbi:hypothetical protein G8S55_13580 [Clostridium botulinum C]|uniref:hypothetical protein n=1 Tax=Clostridium TaxID=1485 RepID=UPI000EA37705|nr:MULTISPECIES: hypothetical protein [Clostridium]AYF54348.1 hypothetical protein DFH04_06335 [Clostridium novyi]MCD3218204.1 hypothetical protein [Clostridium botulinum C]
MNNVHILDARINDIINSEYGFFLNKSNILGVGLGYKVKNGFSTCQKCIKVFVTTKLSQNQLSCQDLIPSQYKGILTDVTEVGYFKFQLLNRKVRPIICGYSIGPNVTEYYKNVGSIGCLVKDKENQEYLLSSAHVITALNKIPLGTDVVQPSLYDMGMEGGEIGKLSKYIPLKQEEIFLKTSNFVDAAIIKLNSGEAALSDIAFLGKPTGVDTAALKDVVFKVGRTSEETSGIVTAINVTCKIPFNDGKKLNKYIFKNQIMTTKMSSDGDSGASLLKSNKKVVGLLVGSTESNTIYNNIQNVLDELNVEIVL